MDRQPTFFDRINAGFGNPMTQFGLNLLAGSMQGDPGKGVASGAQAAGRAQQLQQRQMQEMQAEQERRRAAGAAQAEQAQKQKLFVDAIAGADPKVRPILQMLGPQKAGEFLLKQAQGPAPLSALDQARIAKMKAETERLLQPGQGKITDDMAEYEYAKQNGFQGSFMDYQNAGGDDVPKLSSGYMWDPERPGRAKPIPGGKADAVTGEQAARVGLMMQGKKGIGRVKELALGVQPDPDEGIEGRPSAIGDAYGSLSNPFNIGGHADFQLERGEAGEMRRLMKLGVEGILRATTGAAAPPAEVENLLSIYLPRPEDMPSTRADKLRKYEETLDQVLALATKGATGADLQDEIERLTGVRVNLPDGQSAQQSQLPPGFSVRRVR